LLSTNRRPHHNRLRVKVLPSAKNFFAPPEAQKKAGENAGLLSWNVVGVDQYRDAVGPPQPK
jgi:hypothetical protein